MSDNARQQIVQAYTDAAARGVTPRHRRSMADQLRFFIRMATPLGGAQATALKRQLLQLAKDLGIGELS